MKEFFKAGVFSSMEKCFVDEPIDSKKEISELVAFQNQTVSCQVVFSIDAECWKKYGGSIYSRRYTVRLSGDIKEYAAVFAVDSVPSQYPCNANHDDIYLRTSPGLYPDLIRPVHYQSGFMMAPGCQCTFWIDITVPKGFPKGRYPLTLEACTADGSEVLTSGTVTVRVAQAELPPQKLIHTEWFYTDCIANYYGMEAFSESHWKSIRSFIKTAVTHGINMILTPVFTPELDTYIGGERLTTQLLDIAVDEQGSYHFGFDNLEKWVDLCLSEGVEYFEMPHLFSQWGAGHAPKIIATVNGKKQQIFGWDTDAAGEEYVSFLNAMIPALITFLKEKDIFSNTYFHVSDEPHTEHLEQYRRCKQFISPYVDDEHIIDALSDYRFYACGALKKPVPGIKHIDEFLENHVEGLWAYYCGDSGQNVTGRMFAMPLYRTRILGVQLWLNRIEGFLHWGYNYYNNSNSYNTVNPFLLSDGELFVPSGDTYLVYPGDGGEAWRSLRLNAMKQAMEDMRLLDLCSEKIGREQTVQLIRETAGMEITFTEYPHTPDFFDHLTQRILQKLHID